MRGEEADGVDITYALADDLSMFYWNDSDRSYAMVTRVDDEQGREALLNAAAQGRITGSSAAQSRLSAGPCYRRARVLCAVAPLYRSRRSKHTVRRTREAPALRAPVRWSNIQQQNRPNYPDEAT